MNPLAPRRPGWLPGALVLIAAVAIGSGLGFFLGLRPWAPYLGLIVGVLLAMGWLERMHARRLTLRPPRSRGRLKVIRGGKKRYDLAGDDSTDDQQYLM